MSRIAALEPSETQGKTRELLDAVNKGLGMTPNVFRVAAQSAAALEGLVSLNGALARGTFRARTREVIALAVAEANGCDYCLSAHTALGRGAGLSDPEMAEARRAASSDAKTAAMLSFARTLVLARGRMSAEGLASVRAAGVSDQDIVEVVGNVVVNLFTNYLNLVAETDIDFPRVAAAAR
jgi:uncharacterized peroxidase-related enzyme